MIITIITKIATNNDQISNKYKNNFKNKKNPLISVIPKNL